MELWQRFLSPKGRARLNQVFEGEMRRLVQQVKNNISSAGIKSHTGNLRNSVGYRITGSLRGSVYVGARYASYLEEGYSPFSMQPGLLKGRSAKVSKSGNTYVRIPIGGGRFRTLSARVTPSGRITGVVMGRRRPGEFSQGATRWHHPGYSGRLFLRNAVEKYMPHIVRTVQNSFSELAEKEQG